MGLQLALDRPNLVASLILLEPAAVGGFLVPASEELARRFVGPAMAAFASGRHGRRRSIPSCAAYVVIHIRTCSENSWDRPDSIGLCVSPRSSFAMKSLLSWNSQFGEAEASRVQQPTLVAEGADSARLGPLSQQITALARKLLPHAEIATVAARTT